MFIKRIIKIALCLFFLLGLVKTSFPQSNILYSEKKDDSYRFQYTESPIEKEKNTQIIFESISNTAEKNIKSTEYLFSYNYRIRISNNGKISKNNEKIYSPSSYDFKVNLFNVGFQIFDNDIVKLPFMDNVSLGVKLGYGYYWANWQMYNNATAEKTNADYHNIRGEINLSKHDLFIPLEFFFAYNFYFGADKIQLNLGNNDNHVLTSNSFGAFSLGLRFNIWRTP